jgi:hypothetical protein
MTGNEDDNYYPLIYNQKKYTLFMYLNDLYVNLY